MRAARSNSWGNVWHPEFAPRNIAIPDVNPASLAVRGRGNNLKLVLLIVRHSSIQFKNLCDYKIVVCVRGNYGFVVKKVNNRTCSKRKRLGLKREERKDVKGSSLKQMEWSHLWHDMDYYHHVSATTVGKIEFYTQNFHKRTTSP